MEDYETLPEPQLPLSRYNSDVLLGWFERCELCSLLAFKRYEHAVNTEEPGLLAYGKMKEAKALSWDIVGLLVERGYPPERFDTMRELIREDVNNGD